MSENAPFPERAPASGTPAAPGTRTDQHPAGEPDGSIAPGRRVVLVPTPPGFRRLLIGTVIALLAPFFGILIGSGIGRGDSVTGMQPMYWGFFIGGLIGAAALLLAASGALALLRKVRARDEEAGR